ncbi:MAG: hypothetical protein JW969_12570 [Spirochaetales bacterium]|nr:hypothetical protein [Spirochaetales bacterium]
MKALKMIQYILATILCIALVTAEIATLALINIRNFITTKTITEALKTIDVREILVEQKTAGSDGATGTEKTDNKNKNTGNAAVLENIYSTAKTYGIPKEIVDAVLNSNSIKEFLSAYIGENNGPV